MKLHRLICFSLCLLPVLLGLPGCSTLDPAGSIFKEYNAFQGKPIQAAFNAMGYPDNKQDFGTVIVYQWITNADPGYFQIKIAADKKTGIIESVRGEGNNCGAEYYYPRIHAYYLSTVQKKASN